MPISTFRTLTPLIGAMLAILAVIIAASIGGIAAVDVIRAYASGGTHYAKGHLGGMAALRRYAATGRPQDLQAFRRSIRVPLSDARARTLIERSDAPVADSHPLLVGGRNHPADAPGMAMMLRLFADAPLVAEAVAIWREADREVQRLDALADAIQASWTGGAAGVDRRAALLDEAEAIDARLAVLEDRFAEQLGRAARGTTTLLYGGLSALGLALAALVVALGRRAQRRLALAQDTVLEREERFRDIAELAVGWIWETDATLRFTYFSDGVERAIAAPKDLLIGQPPTAMALFEDDARRHRLLDDLGARRPFQGVECAFDRPSGERRYFRLNGKPVHGPDGRFAGYRGTGTDVTEEVAARRELAANNALLQTVFENISQGISVVGPDLRLLAFNERFLDLLGFPRDRFAVGTPYSAFIRYNAERGEYGEVDVNGYVAAAMEAARRFEPHAFERVRPDGTVLQIRGQPLPGGGFVTTYTDITGLRRAARDLQAAKISAETANHAKSAFLANMSHELRTPLNAVIGFADLMAEERFGPLGGRYVGYACDIRQSGEHLLAVINDILDITRVEAGKIELSVEAVSPAELVDECIRMLRQRALEAGIALHSQIPDDAEPIRADRQRLRQIVLNLVGNAIKFSADGGEVVVRHLETAGEWGLQVVDHGIGIAPDQIDLAFEPFAQLHAGFGRKYDGAGLGLPLVRRFVELHGGRVSMESEVGSGTTVTVWFPRDRPGAPAEAEPGLAVPVG